MFDLCPPALIYVVFSITQIIIDTFKGLYNTAFFKFIVMCMVTLLLNALCQSGMGVISWIIVFIPFILMTIITSMLLFVFGLSPSEGDINYNVDYPNNGKHHENNKNNGNENNNKEKSNNDDYNPNDFTSGTPDDINNYNN